MNNAANSYQTELLLERNDSNTNMQALMAKEKRREIVIEIEMVKLIRKRAKTTLGHCERCDTECDFIGIHKVAELFEMTVGDLTQFVVNTSVHCVNRRNEDAICVPSLLSILGSRLRGSDRRPGLDI